VRTTSLELAAPLVNFNNSVLFIRTFASCYHTHMTSQTKHNCQ